MSRFGARILCSAFLAGCGPTYRVEAPRVAMDDGVRLAADVILPKEVPTEGLPIVMIHTRYWRSFQLKMQQPSDKMPIQPREDIAKALVDAGFGVVLVDVRGTGASEGTWERPWSDDEVGDLGRTIDWIAAQPWCDGRVGSYGLSYEGTTALLAATRGGPLRAALVREIEWDLVDELLAPGGVRNITFADAWGRSVAALDRGEWPEMFPKGPKFIVRGPRRTDDDPDGTQLAALIANRSIADVAASVEGVRRPEDPFGAGGPPAGEVGPSHWAPELAASGVAIGLWGGWWDGATGDAVLRADAAIPLVEARIGPWNHEGTENIDPLGRRRDSDARVELDDLVAFFKVNLAGSGADRPRRQWYVTGAERWESGDVWPTTHDVAWPLRGDGVLGGAPDPGLASALDVDFATTVGKDTRWTAGLLRPVDAPDRAGATGLVSWTTAPFSSPLGAFGVAQFTCDVDVSASEAALHVYLEAVDARGHVRLLTEGVRRVTGGAVQVPLRAIAFELGEGDALRLSIAGADADSFERVPATGDARLTMRGEGCALTLPER